MRILLMDFNFLMSQLVLCMPNCSTAWNYHMVVLGINRKVNNAYNVIKWIGHAAQKGLKSHILPHATVLSIYIVSLLLIPCTALFHHY